MAQPRLIKKRLALYVEAKKGGGLSVVSWYSQFIKLVMTYMSNKMKTVDMSKYPLTEDLLRKALKLEKVNGYWVIGLRTEGIHALNQETFNKLIDVEYGVNGVEIRIVTRALETLIQIIRKENPNVSIIL